MNINFDLYKIFYYVCRYHSITEAAKHLYVSQPAITKQIQNLEMAFGMPLFVRHKKGLELTREGQDLYLKIKDSIETLLSIEEEKEIPTIQIIAGYSTIKNFLLEHLSKFHKNHPDVQFEVSTHTYHEAINRLKEGKADLIFLNMKDREDPSLNDLVVKKCYNVQDILVVSKDFDACKVPSKLSLLDLNEYPIICKSGKSIARQNIEEYFLENHKEFHPMYELSNNWLIEEYVRMNLGIGLVTKEFVKEELENGEFLEVRTDIELPIREIGYATRKNHLYHSIIDEFMKTLKEDIEKK